VRNTTSPSTSARLRVPTESVLEVGRARRPQADPPGGQVLPGRHVRADVVFLERPHVSTRQGDTPERILSRGSSGGTKRPDFLSLTGSPPGVASITGVQTKTEPGGRGGHSRSRRFGRVRLRGRRLRPASSRRPVRELLANGVVRVFQETRGTRGRKHQGSLSLEFRCPTSVES